MRHMELLLRVVVEVVVVVEPWVLAAKDAAH